MTIHPRLKRYAITTAALAAVAFCAYQYGHDEGEVAGKRMECDRFEQSLHGPIACFRWNDDQWVQNLVHVRGWTQTPAPGRPLVFTRQGVELIVIPSDTFGYPTLSLQGSISNMCDALCTVDPQLSAWSHFVARHYGFATPAVPLPSGLHFVRINCENKMEIFPLSYP